ncbi:MAG: hypothetical protein KC466_05530 [Myxococcales bacterium]|nr:hypothetical protein [Myxococcales bacterium]
MKAEQALAGLIDALKGLAIDVRIERLGVGTAGGLCRIEGQPVIFVEKTLAPRDRLEFLVGELHDLGTDEIFLPPAVREIMDRVGAKSRREKAAGAADETPST